MKVLAYSRIALAQDRGTPLRFRQLVEALARFNDVELRLISREDSADVARVLPGVAHFPAVLGAESDVLHSQLRAFEPDIIYGLTDKAAYDMAALKRLDTRAKLVVDLHGYLPAERLEDGGRSWLSKWIASARAWINLKYHFPQIDAFTTVGQILAAKFSYLGKPSQVLWGGVNIDVFKSLPSTPSSTIRVAYAGNYRPYQGVTTLLEAAAILVEKNEPFHFTLVGDIDKFPAVKELATKALGKKATLTGRVPYEQVPQILSKADVLVVPRSPSTAAQYNYPSKLSEYLALGKPVIVHGVGEVNHVIQDGGNGLIVPPESPDELTGALIKLKDLALREKLGCQARQFAVQELSWKIIGAKLHQFLGDLLQEA